MTRQVVAIAIGFVCAVLFLGIAVAADGGLFVAHWMRDLFIQPPLWLLQTGFPAIWSGFAIQPGSPQSSFLFFGAFFVAFWWVICGMIVFVLRRQPPNISLKRTNQSLRD